MTTQRFRLYNDGWACSGCNAVLAEDGTIGHHHFCPELPSGREAARISTLRKTIREMQVVAERKNRELDALHMVWCDGGCSGGVHRWSDALITKELVETAVRNTHRLQRWYRTVEFRLSLPGSDEWQRRRYERAARKTDLRAPE